MSWQLRTTSPRQRLPQLRANLRQLCDRHGVGLEVRARLVLAATMVARAAPPGSPLTLSATVLRDTSPAVLVITVELTAPPAGLPELPLPAEAERPGKLVWRLPAPANPASAEFGAAATDEELATEDELRAVLARMDGIEQEHRQLKHEIAETNSGVLAMYVDLEQRDEQLREAHALIFRELKHALRPPPPVVPGVELGVRYDPADPQAPTGGDLYDWFLLPDGTLHITVVDAVGHGVTCTRHALQVTHAVRALALEGRPLEELIERTAHTVLAGEPRLRATVQVARLHPGTGELWLAGGGHPPALVVSEEDCLFLPTPGRGIGFPAPGSDNLVRHRLRRGDLLLLHTDGLTESRKDAEEGEQRLRETARRHAHSPVDVLTEAVVRDMHEVVTHLDDTLLLAARFRG
ncbi:PP2C family protein-serine/threonine phosphatase [Amycolatopsis magusensis]|uniref:PP2C family protein-serine/threonine phosphatase n=1 Tax=Amycolatopsis magusensis TaxID=882444 RepID=UPI0037A60267